MLQPPPTEWATQRILLPLVRVTVPLAVPSMLQVPALRVLRNLHILVKHKYMPDKHFQQDVRRGRLIPAACAPTRLWLLEP